jgi:hypothetical protein
MTRPYRRKPVIPDVVSYEGAHDGIRFGVLLFGKKPRHYHYDRMTGSVSLFVEYRESEVDRDPQRRSEALAALRAYELTLPHDDRHPGLEAVEGRIG